MDFRKQFLQDNTVEKVWDLLPKTFYHLNSKLFSCLLLPKSCKPSRETQRLMPNCWLLTALPGLKNNQEKDFVFCSTKSPARAGGHFFPFKLAVELKHNQADQDSCHDPSQDT